MQVNPVDDIPNARDEAYSQPDVDFLDGVQDRPLVIDTADLLLAVSDIGDVSIVEGRFVVVETPVGFSGSVQVT